MKVSAYFFGGGGCALRKNEAKEGSIREMKIRTTIIKLLS